MQRYCNTKDLGGALEAAKQLHERMRLPVKKQEALLKSAMDRGSQNSSALDYLGDVVENYTYVLDALLGPQLVSGDSTTTVRAPGGELAQMHAQNLPHAVGKIQRETGFTRELRLCATDFILGWAILEVKYEDLSLDQSEDAVIPVARHVNPDDLMALPGARRWEHAGAFFHRRVLPKAKLEKMARDDKDGNWNMDRVKTLEQVPGEVYYDSDDVVYYEGWMLPDDETLLPGTLEEDGPKFHGIDFLCDQEGNYLRDPERHIGPKRAPFYMAGATQPTDEMYPVSPAVASAENNDRVESMHASITEKMHNQQTLVFMKGDKVDIEGYIENQVDVYIPVGTHFDLKESILEVTVQGPTRDQWEYLDVQRGAMDRVSGITDMQRGQTGSRVSATEASIVNSASGARLDGMIGAFYQMVEEAVTEQCWALTTDDDILLALPQDASTDSGKELPMWQGGLPDGVTYHSLGLDISVANGHRTNPEIMANRYVRGLDVAMMVAKLKQGYPDLNDEGILRRIFDTMEVPELRDMVLGDPAPEPQAGGPSPGNGAAVADPRQIPAAGAGAPLAMGGL